MKDSEYQRLYDEVHKELVTPGLRSQLDLIVEYAGEHVAADLDAARVEIERLTKDAQHARDEETTMRDVLRAEHAECKRLRAENEQLTKELSSANEERRRRERHPMAPERCPECEWTNTHLMNYGEPGKGLWLCHGCAARRIKERDEAIQTGRMFPLCVGTTQLAPANRRCMRCLRYGQSCDWRDDERKAGAE